MKGAPSHPPDPPTGILTTGSILAGDAGAAQGRACIRASVVIATRDRPTLLARCLEALLEQSFTQGWEIVVVEDASPAEQGTATGAVVEQTRLGLGREGAPHLRYLRNPGPAGPAAARNAGWRAARGGIIAFTDDDCLPRQDWLEKGVAAFVDGVAGVSGKLVVPLHALPSDYEANAAHLSSAEFVTANCFYRRSALVAAGGFDERFKTAWREDSDLFFTLLEQGARLVEEPGAVVLHPLRSAPWGVSIKQQRKTAYNALLRAKHPQLYRTRIQRSPWFYPALVASLVAAFVLALTPKRKRALLPFAAWTSGTTAFALSRLRGTRHDAGHVAEMMVTSAAIPALSLFWRLFGRLKYRTARP